MMRRSTSGDILVRVLLGIAGAFAVTLVSWLVASGASAAEQPSDPLSPVVGLVDEATEPVAPVHDVVRHVTEAVVPPLRTDQIVATLTAPVQPVLDEPARITGTTTAKRAKAADLPPPPVARKRPGALVAPRPPEPQALPLHVAHPAPRAEPPPPPVPPPAPATDSSPQEPGPVAPVTPMDGAFAAPLHVTDPAAACPARPVPPPMPVRILTGSSPVVVEFVLTGRPAVSPD